MVGSPIFYLFDFYGVISSTSFHALHGQDVELKNIFLIPEFEFVCLSVIREHEIEFFRVFQSSIKFEFEFDFSTNLVSV